MGSRYSRKTLPVIPAKAGIHKGALAMKQSALYAMANKPNGMLYIQV